MQQSELQELKKQMRTAKSKTRKEELKHEINLRAQELTENKKKEKIKSALTKRKRDERDAVASGKNPFYLKVCFIVVLYVVLAGHLFFFPVIVDLLTRNYIIYEFAAQRQEEFGAPDQVPGPAGEREAVQVHGQEAQEERQQGPPLAADAAQDLRRWLRRLIRSRWLVHHQLVLCFTANSFWLSSRGLFVFILSTE